MHDVAFVNAHLATMSHGDVRDGVLAATGDRISWAGSRKEWRDTARIEHDARGAWITPALIDCHTHLVYAGNRAREFELRLNGATYDEIARAGSRHGANARDARGGKACRRRAVGSGKPGRARLRDRRQPLRLSLIHI